MKVSIQQAAANAFAAWLEGELLDVVVEPRWPAPDKKKPPKSITVVTSGSRHDLPIDLRVLKKTNLGPTQTTAIWQVAACTQPFQLDVWALSDVERDDILARLDELLLQGDSSLSPSLQPAKFLPMPVGTGNLIAVQNGWESSGAIADFCFQNPDLETTSDAVGRSLYRATFRGNAYFMLTATTVTARQLVADFKIRLSETDGILSDFP